MEAVQVSVKIHGQEQWKNEDGWNHDKNIVPDIVGMQYQGFFMCAVRYHILQKIP